MKATNILDSHKILFDLSFDYFKKLNVTDGVCVIKFLKYYDSYMFLDVMNKMELTDIQKIIDCCVSNNIINNIIDNKPRITKFIKIDLLVNVYYLNTYYTMNNLFSKYYVSNTSIVDLPYYLKNCPHNIYLNILYNCSGCPYSKYLEKKSCSVCNKYIHKNKRYVVSDISHLLYYLPGMDDNEIYNVISLSIPTSMYKYMNIYTSNRKILEIIIKYNPMYYMYIMTNQKNNDIFDVFITTTKDSKHTLTADYFINKYCVKDMDYRLFCKLPHMYKHEIFVDIYYNKLLVGSAVKFLNIFYSTEDYAPFYYACMLMKDNVEVMDKVKNILSKPISKKGGDLEKYIYIFNTYIGKINVDYEYMICYDNKKFVEELSRGNVVMTDALFNKLFAYCKYSLRKMSKYVGLYSNYKMGMPVIKNIDLKYKIGLYAYVSSLKKKDSCKKLALVKQQFDVNEHMLKGETMKSILEKSVVVNKYIVSNDYISKLLNIRNGILVDIDNLENQLKEFL